MAFEKKEPMYTTPCDSEEMISWCSIRCGKCGRRVSMRAAKDGALCYVCLECGTRATAEGVNEAAVSYVNALINPDVKERLYSATQQFERARREDSERRARNVSIRAKKLRLEISELEESLEIKRRQLKELGVEPYEPEFAPEDLDAYFEGWKPLDELDEDYWSRAARAIAHFIGRIELHPDRFEFSSTLDAWLAKRKAERNSKSVRPDAFEEGEDRCQA